MTGPLPPHETRARDAAGARPGLGLRLLPSVFFLGIIGLVYYLCATALSEQGYASGTPITNAALYPRLLVTVLLVMTLAQIVAEIRGGQTATGEALGVLTRKRLIQVVQCTCLAGAYLILLPIIGYLALTPPFVALLLLSLGDRNAMKIVVFSVLLTLGCSLVFQGLFNVNLPRGLFGIALNL